MDETAVIVKMREQAYPVVKAKGSQMDLQGKRVVAIGERDGINGPSLRLLAESAGADVVFSVTECFV